MSEESKRKSLEGNCCRDVRGGGRVGWEGGRESGDVIHHSAALTVSTRVEGMDTLRSACYFKPSIHDLKELASSHGN